MLLCHYLHLLTHSARRGEKLISRQKWYGDIRIDSHLSTEGEYHFEKVKVRKLCSWKGGAKERHGAENFFFQLWGFLYGIYKGSLLSVSHPHLTNYCVPRRIKKANHILYFYFKKIISLVHVLKRCVCFPLKFMSVQQHFQLYYYLHEAHLSVGILLLCYSYCFHNKWFPLLYGDILQQAFFFHIKHWRF